jgi:hypothetical protein
MSKFCDVCKKISQCSYCIKYGHEGIYLWMEQDLYNKRDKIQEKNKEKKQDYSLDLINTQQLYTLSIPKKD